MISQNTLKPNPGSRKRFKSLGRGDGSGKGSYSTKGCKGQSARSGGKTKPGFEGGQTPLIRRMPKVKGFRNPNLVEYQVINVGKLNVFEDNATVDIIQLFERGLISLKNRPIKVLGDGDVSKKLTLKVDGISESAKKKIEAKGGSVILPAVAKTASK